MTLELTDTEFAFLKEQQIGRLATASPDGKPDVAPSLAIWKRSLGAFLFGGRGIERTRRYNNARRNSQASLLFDDVQLDPYEIRGLKFTGSVTIHVADDDINVGSLGDPLLVFRPEHKSSWGLEEPAFGADGVFRIRIDGGEPTTF